MNTMNAKLNIKHVTSWGKTCVFSQPLLQQISGTGVKDKISFHFRDFVYITVDMTEHNSKLMLPATVNDYYRHKKTYATLLPKDGFMEAMMEIAIKSYQTPAPWEK